MRRLREEYSLYAVDSGRICVSALNTRNVDYVAKAIANETSCDAKVSFWKGGKGGFP